MDAKFKKVFSDLAAREKEMVNSLVEMCRIPAYHPSSGGDGEAEKAKHLEGLIKSLDLNYKIYNAPDKSVSSGYRPNIIVYPDKFPKGTEKRIWVVSHMDVVPPGALDKWHNPPFEPCVRNGKVFGRGTEDNGQAVISSLFALWALKNEGLGVNGGAVLVADEETGSKKGIQYLLAKKIFNKNDLIVIPDWGSATGDSIEIAEKSILWIKLITEGKQAHASTPQRGINAYRAASKLLCRLDEKLHEKFGSRNEIFDPPFSTFEPTKKESNVPNVNTIPGTDISYFDCRVLPEYSLEDLIAIVKDQVEAIENEMNVKINVSFVHKERSPSTSEQSEVVLKVKNALKEVRNLDGKVIGIGGGTCAAYFRKKGIDVAVWQTCEGVAHSINEYSKTKNIVNDAKIFAHVLGR
jgi:succinyl-diaminopimelate desuccinylase